eukprot:4365238-Amphidinium_carterae.2
MKTLAFAPNMMRNKWIWLGRRSVETNIICRTTSTLLEQGYKLNGINTPDPGLRQKTNYITENSSV